MAPAPLGSFCPTCVLLCMGHWADDGAGVGQLMALGLVGRAEAGVLLCLHCPPACCCTCDPWGGLPACLSQSNAPILPIMLATKLLPEMEAEEQALLQQLVEEQRPYAAGAGAAGAPPPLSPNSACNAPMRAS